MHKYAEYFFESSSIVVNTTGSAMVRKFLSQSEMKARVIEASAMNSGEIGLFTLEGSERNPSTIDLVTYAYDLLRQSSLLEVADSLNPNLLQIGVGCNSVTLAISDAKLSLIAAGVGQKLLNIYENGLPVNGLASLAMVGEDGMSVCWAHHKVGPTQFANLTDTGGWNIRILESAHQKIIHDVEQNINVETGGLLVGRVSPLSREIIVTGILPAPPDSIRSKTEFILGVEGRANQISNYETAAKGVLWCIGTWHSHLGPFGPSTTDISTADILEGAIKGAALLLIRRPDGYSAVVRRGC
jgi:proteasome lid subunit RPN8/RPN11